MPTLTPTLTPTLAPSSETLGVFGARTENIRRRHRHGRLMPSWVLFSTILLATFALCVSVTMRTGAEMRRAEQHFGQMTQEVEMLRTSNATLKGEVKRLHTDHRAIEATARERFDMVRADEIVVPLN